jgi:exopolyphosphatase/guanosine-5'-triphosphate,3'-diphosphate pyrophosphatase
MRIAAIDIGTNSIHLVIAQSRGGTSFDVVDREREVVQIGRGSFTGRRLKRAAIRRTVEALERFVRLARRHQVDKVICTATAAVREARNGGEFLQAARHACGITPRVIPAEEEGRLIYLGVKSALQLDEQPALIVDIGGGSVQLVAGDRDQCRHTASAPLGALRLTELLISEDPPSRRELARLRRRIRVHLRAALRALEPFEPSRAFGSSGSIHALAQLASWMDSGAVVEQLNGFVLEAANLDRVAARVARMSQAERERLPGIDAARAEILLAGAMVLKELLSMLGLEAITVSDYGVREGLVTDYLAYHAREITKLEEVTDLRLRSVYALLARFNADGNHPRHVAKLALELFDGMRSLHELPPEAREWLHFAALLHDVGSVVGYDGHQEHSAYLIRNGGLRGLSAREIALVALTARYHGKSRPRKRDADFAELNPADRRAVRWLAALLRIAEGLDRSHYQLIRSLRVARRKDSVSIVVSARREAQLELWAARRRIEQLERLLGGRARLLLERPATAEVREAARARRPLPSPAPSKSRRAPASGRSAPRRGPSPSGTAASATRSTR